MEEQLNKYFSEYEKLLKSKDYNMLSNSERCIVSRFSTEKEYNETRKIILLNSEIINEDKKSVNPDPEILNNLITAIKSNNTSFDILKVVKNILEYRIRVYQFALYAAASIILLIIISNKEKIVTIQNPVYISKADTVEKDLEKNSDTNIQKIVQINYTQKDTDETLVKEKAQDKTQILIDANDLELYGIPVSIKDNVENYKPKGRSVYDDSSLVKYFVKI